MKVIQSLSDIQEKFALTIGNFDGVHLGHQALINDLLERNKGSGLALAVVTFVPHPQAILNNQSKKFLIETYQRRRDLLAKLGVDYLCEISFTRDFSTLSPDDFLGDYILVNRYLKQINLGYDFAFGADKKGSYELVKKRAAAFAVEVTLEDKFENSSDVVSSSLIRNFLHKGNVEQAKENLGRNFSLKGLVIKGEGRGKKIGVPTANISFDESLIIPKRGVYITSTSYKEMLFASVTNIGINPTFKADEDLSVETHIFDFDGDIYGESIEVHFHQRLRDERKFANVHELVEQLKKDIDTSRDYFES